MWRFYFKPDVFQIQQEIIRSNFENLRYLYIRYSKQNTWNQNSFI